MKRTENYPHPGEAPPEPGPKPPYDHRIDFDANDRVFRVWTSTRTRRDTYDRALRRHTVAAALDELNGSFCPSAAERVAKVLAEEYLGSC